MIIISAFSIPPCMTSAIPISLDLPHYDICLTCRITSALSWSWWYQHFHHPQLHVLHQQYLLDFNNHICLACRITSAFSWYHILSSLPPMYDISSPFQSEVWHISYRPRARWHHIFFHAKVHSLSTPDVYDISFGCKSHKYPPPPNAQKGYKMNQGILVSSVLQRELYTLHALLFRYIFIAT